jgi:hypothetical protein
VQAKVTSETTTTKIRPTSFSLSHAQFIKHIAGMIEKPPRKHIKKLEKIQTFDLVAQEQDQNK